MLNTHRSRLHRAATAVLLAFALASSAHAMADEAPETADGVRKLMRYLRCTFEIMFAYDPPSTGAAAVDCTALYLAEVN